MTKEMKLTLALRSLLRAAEAASGLEPWDKGFNDRKEALEEACVEARGVLRVLGNEGATLDLCSDTPSSTPHPIGASDSSSPDRGDHE